MADNLNLTPERGPNVWDKKPERESETNWKSGAVMLAAGAAAAFVGGRMLYRAVRESRDTRLRDTRSLASDEADDIVGEESAQSFPASDSPSWTPTAGANADKRTRWR